MAKANPSLRLNTAIVTLARQQAIKAVSGGYQAKGVKVYQIAHKEIIVAANEYLREHRELIAEAAEIVKQWRREGFFGKRLRDAQNLKLLCVEQSRAAQGLQIHECQTQNGSEK